MLNLIFLLVNVGVTVFNVVTGSPNSAIFSGFVAGFCLCAVLDDVR